MAWEKDEGIGGRDKRGGVVGHGQKARQMVGDGALLCFRCGYRHASQCKDSVRVWHQAVEEVTEWKLGRKVIAPGIIKGFGKGQVGDESGESG